MSSLSRRELLKWGAMGSATIALAACAPKAPEPAAPAAPAPKEPEVKQPEAPKQVEEVITLRFLTRQGSSGDHMREFGTRFVNESGGKVQVEVDKAADANAPFIAVAHLYFNSVDDFKKAFAVHAAEFITDSVNYTDIALQVQISEIVK